MKKKAAATALPQNWRDELVIDVPTAARILEVGRTKLYEMLLVGTIKSAKVGARRLVSVKSLEAYVEGATGRAGESNEAAS